MKQSRLSSFAENLSSIKKTLSNQSNGKIYLIKRKIISTDSFKQPKSFFHNLSQKQYKIKSFKDSQFKSIDYQRENINNNEQNLTFQLNQNHRKYIYSTLIGQKQIPVRTESNIYLENLNQNQLKSFQNSIFNSRIKKQKILFEGQKKQINLKNKITFKTVCDKNFNKFLLKQQTTIQQEIKQQNPEQKRRVFPNIQKKNMQHANKRKLQRNLSEQINSREKNWIVSQQKECNKQLNNKMVLQRINKYRQRWVRKQKERRGRDYKDFGVESMKSFDELQKRGKSLMERSEQKSKKITINFNNDSQSRLQKSEWQRQLRGQIKNCKIIGRQEMIEKLKGNNIQKLKSSKEENVNDQLNTSVKKFENQSSLKQEKNKFRRLQFYAQEIYKIQKNENKRSKMKNNQENHKKQLKRSQKNEKY